MQTPKFLNVQDPFHTVLKSRVQAYFKDNKKATTGNGKLFSKALILLGGLTLVYVWLVFFTPAALPALFLCAVLGMFTAAIGFNVMHDGAHGSFSKHPVVNKLAAFSLNLLGGSSFMWNVKHNVIHHAYTNVDGIDDDIDIKPWMRMSTTQKRHAWHKFQHLYFWVLYSFMYIIWIFFLDYQKYFKRKVGTVPLKKMKRKDHLFFWGFKVLHLAIFFALPLYMVGFSHFIIGFLVYTLVAGFTISIVFQLAHTVEHTQFPMPDAITGNFESEWAIHQIQTTANFANNNKLVSWFTGGLNFQIEHHLFPKISHVHYPAISRIIKQACQEHHLQYIEFPKMSGAIRSHVAFLRQMGRS